MPNIVAKILSKLSTAQPTGLPIGMRVRLASGGPIMLVTDSDSHGWEVFCSWDGGEGWFKIFSLDIIRRRHVAGWQADGGK